ncbi:MAG TPA: S8 family serine peptidase [Polyangiaceae bacterium]|jgi:MYXO-CTERM domain-containing protein
MPRIAVALHVSLASAVALWSAPAPAAERRVADEQADREALESVVPRHFKSLCAASATPGFKHCLAKVVTDPDGVVVPMAGPTGGLRPADLQSAYVLPPTGGNGRLVAAVDAFDYPNAEADLAVYRAQYGLPPCTTANGCFQKVNENGGPNLPGLDPAGGCNAGWSGETALDLQMISAACPDCRILLVEASAPDNSLATGVDTAVELGAVAVSNSYGGGEDIAGGDKVQEPDYTHPGVLITVSAGDEGYGAEYPATSAGVVAVGGTTLKKSSSTRGWAEAAWRHGGSGCSAEIPKPVWQTDTVCKYRMNADVSAVGDPATGVAVFCSDPSSLGGWTIVGGTSVSAPFVAAAFTVMNVPSDPGFVWTHPRFFFDVTTGINGKCATTYFCSSGIGYDGPTGWGTLNGELLIEAQDLDGGLGDDDAGAIDSGAGDPDGAYEALDATPASEDDSGAPVVGASDAAGSGAAADAGGNGVSPGAGPLGAAYVGAAGCGCRMVESGRDRRAAPGVLLAFGIFGARRRRAKRSQPG